MSNETTYEVHFARGAHGRVDLVEGAAPVPGPSTPVPARIARLVALAHQLEELVRAEAVRDYAQVAQLSRITRARVSQIMAMLNLAPDLQEQLLLMTKPPKGRERIGEREIRPICQELDWAKQREMFQRMSRARGQSGVFSEGGR